METHYQRAAGALRAAPRTWLVTGAAGFIGSHLVERLLELGQTVVGLDNFDTGYRANLAGFDSPRFRFIEGDIRDLDACRAGCMDTDVVLHQAALGSVPRSIDDPLTTNAANVDGFLNVLVAARDARVSRFVYAASSAAYGDSPELPKVEDAIGAPLSPYAVSKIVNELYADVFGKLYGTETIGLRYFNVFGPRQDPDGAYAAVIPRWIGKLLSGEPCEMYGDGAASRDFCYIENAVQANLLAATTSNAGAIGQIYNIACGERTTLVQLYQHIADALRRVRPSLRIAAAVKVPPRPGDIEHSLADITKARARLGYDAPVPVAAGLAATVHWFADHAATAAGRAGGAA